MMKTLYFSSYHVDGLRTLFLTDNICFDHNDIQIPTDFAAPLAELLQRFRSEYFPFQG